MASLQELIAKKEALEHEIEQAKTKDRSEAIAKVRTLMDEYGLTVADLAVQRGSKQRGGKGTKVAAKFRNTATGETWSGRGLQPKWLKAALAGGQKLGDFAI